MPKVKIEIDLRGSGSYISAYKHDGEPRLLVASGEVDLILILKPEQAYGLANQAKNVCNLLAKDGKGIA